MDPQVYVNRLVRLCKFDTTVFEDMRDDPQGLIPAVAIAAVSFLLAGIGGWLWWVISNYGNAGKVFLESAIVGTITATIAWGIWVAVAFFLLSNVFKYEADLQRMLKACGLAVVPFAISLLMFIPSINLGVGLVGIGLTFLLMDIGIQVSVEAQPGHVILATFIGFVVFCLILSLLVGGSAGIGGTNLYAFSPGPFLFRVPDTIVADAGAKFGSNAVAPTNQDVNAFINSFKNAANGR